MRLILMVSSCHLNKLPKAQYDEIVNKIVFGTLATVVKTNIVIMQADKRGYGKLIQLAVVET